MTVTTVARGRGGTLEAPIPDDPAGPWASPSAHLPDRHSSRQADPGTPRGSWSVTREDRGDVVLETADTNNRPANKQAAFGADHYA